MHPSPQTTTYGGVTKTLHWLTALTILAAFPLGMIANNAPIGSGEEITQKLWLFSLHKTIGVTAFLIALVRILWALRQVKPGLLSVEKPVEVFLAEFIHWMLYIAMLVVPLSGWLHHSATTGLAPILWPFGQSLPFIPVSDAYAHFFSGLHFVFTKVLLVSVGLHVAGALKHAFIDRDKTLSRMLPFTGDMPTPPAQTHSRVPMIVAIVLFAGALALGSVFGLGGAPGPRDAPTENVANVATGAHAWQVESGTLAITITQFGNEITGVFQGWSAAIEFDPDLSGTQELGQVTVEVPIAGLTLGSVTDQAMEADFFSVEEFPIATFKAGIFRVSDGFEARGNLSLKGTELPVTLPFTLDLVAGVGDVQGQVTLQRLDFHIGESMADEGSLKFAVEVAVALKVLRHE